MSDLIYSDDWSSNDNWVTVPAQNSQAGGFWSDPIGAVVGYYGAFYDAQQKARLADLSYQDRQLALVEKYKTGNVTAEPVKTAPSQGAVGWVQANPVMALALGVGALWLLKQAKVI
jgi:hypothetical protein